ncbi:DoxX family protein [bacterium]|jgi:putative oxidoreductase|nr:DoxX family protein [bacterium]MBT5015644.1 DoxX family protein [bacterium]
MKQVIFSNNENLKSFGLFLIRIGLGAIFIYHGWPKVIGGVDQWHWLGLQMSHVGITFMPAFWGLLAALIEFLGGICLVLGLGTRFWAFLLACVMFVAFAMHYKTGDAWVAQSHPLSLCVVFIGLMIAGSGMFAVDRFFRE